MSTDLVLYLVSKKTLGANGGGYARAASTDGVQNIWRSSLFTVCLHLMVSCSAIDAAPQRQRSSKKRKCIKSGFKLCDMSIWPPKIIYNTLNTDMATALFSSLITKDKRQMQYQYVQRIG